MTPASAMAGSGQASPKCGSGQDRKSVYSLAWRKLPLTNATVLHMQRSAERVRASAVTLRTTCSDGSRRGGVEVCVTFL